MGYCVGTYVNFLNLSCGLSSFFFNKLNISSSEHSSRSGGDDQDFSQFLAVFPQARSEFMLRVPTQPLGLLWLTPGRVGQAVPSFTLHRRKRTGKGGTGKW